MQEKKHEKQFTQESGTAHYFPRCSNSPNDAQRHIGQNLVPLTKG